MDFSLSARRLGISAAAGIVLLGLGYAVTLIVGLVSLQSPQQPIGGWPFPILELLAGRRFGSSAHGRGARVGASGDQGV